MTSHHWIGEIPDPTRYFGFIYLIECITTGKKYIGKKQYWASKSGSAGCKSKVSDRSSDKWKPHCWKESDWRYYTGSSKDFNKHIDDIGKENFLFTILSQHSSKGSLHYSEIEEQVFRNVLKEKNSEGEYVYFNRQIAAIKFRPPETYPDVAKDKFRVWWNGLTQQERDALNAKKGVKGPDNPHYGKPLSEGRKKHLSEMAKGRESGFKGKKHTDETKKVIGEKSATKVYTDEYRELLSKAQSGENNGNHHDCTYHFVSDNGEEFTGTRFEFINKFRVDPSSLSKLIRGTRKTILGWRLKL